MTLLECNSRVATILGAAAASLSQLIRDCSRAVSAVGGSDVTILTFDDGSQAQLTASTGAITLGGTHVDDVAALLRIVDAVKALPGVADAPAPIVTEEPPAAPPAPSAADLQMAAAQEEMAKAQADLAAAQAAEDHPAPPQ